MTLNKIKEFLRANKGYLKKSPYVLANRTNSGLIIAKSALMEVKDEFRVKVNPKIKRLFFDIETTPNLVYSWRIGYNINISHESIVEERRIISIHYKWAGKDKVHHLKWDEDQNDKEMLEKFIIIANKANEIIAHNGDRFDIKWLRTRCIYHRIPMLPKYKTLDTLKKAKTYFNFNSNKLDYIAKFLGVGKKLDHEGYELWLKVMRGDKKALKKMLKYGDHDVIILEKAYNIMKQYIYGNTHHGVHSGKESSTCPNCGKKGKHVNIDVTPAGTIQHIMQCTSCNSIYKISNFKYLKI